MRACYDILPHFHGALEIIYVEGRPIKMSVGEEIFTVGKGEVLVVPSFITHHSLRHADTCLNVMCVPPDYIDGFKQTLDTKEFMPHIIRAGKAVELIARIFNILFEDLSINVDGYSENIQGGAQTEYNAKFEYRESYLTRGLVCAILGLILETVPVRISPSGMELESIREILIYLGKNYKKKISRKSIAAVFGYSENHISHLFNKSVGISIPIYLNSLRVRAAAALMMKNGEIAADEVASITGFDSMSTFYRVFKDCYGTTPYQFRKLLAPGAEAIKETCREKSNLFGSAGKGE